MFVSSGIINGKKSVFVVPAALPVSQDAVRVDAIDIGSGWLSGWVDAGMSIGEDINTGDIQSRDRSDVKHAGVATQSSVLGGRDANPYAWSDKDFIWQDGGPR